MTEILINVGLTLLGLAIIGGAFYVYQRKLKHVPHDVALRQAVSFAYEIWKASDFVAPSALRHPDVAMKALREAGLVLKAELVGQSTYAGKLPLEVAKIHPEFAGVDPEQLALGVQAQILKGV